MSQKRFCRKKATKEEIIKHEEEKIQKQNILMKKYFDSKKIETNKIILKKWNTKMKTDIKFEDNDLTISSDKFLLKLIKNKLNL